MKYNIIFICSVVIIGLVVFNSCRESNKGLKKSKLNRVTAPKTGIDNKCEIVSEEKMETSYKAQLIEYVWYKDTVYTQDALRSVMSNVYDLASNKEVFESHDNATVVAVYVFTSKEAMKDRAEWISMLIKGPRDIEPQVSFNRFKLTALNDLKDGVKSQDEIDLDKLNAYLNKRGLDLCSLSNQLKKLELDNIHKADARYPDFGTEHMAMVDKLDDQSYKKLRLKHNLSENMLGKVSIFAMSYCK